MENMIEISNLEDLKPINIQHTNDGPSASILGVDVVVDLFHNPREEAIVSGLCQSIPGECGLKGGGKHFNFLKRNKTETTTTTKFRKKKRMRRK